MASPDDPEGADPQSSWITVYFETDEAGPETPPGRSVMVTITHRLEVLDVSILRTAVEEIVGPARDELDRRLRQVPANLVGQFLSETSVLPHVPGTEQRGSSMSVGDDEPDRE